jgi:hypothetical protein
MTDVVERTEAFVLTLITTDSRADLMVDGRLPENSRLSVAPGRQSDEESWDYAVTKASVQSTYWLRLFGPNGFRDVRVLPAPLALLARFGWTDEPPDHAEAVVDARVLDEALDAL